jgi:hypothetical protein
LFGEEQTPSQGGEFVSPDAVPAVKAQEQKISVETSVSAAADESVFASPDQPAVAPESKPVAEKPVAPKPDETAFTSAAQGAPKVEIPAGSEPALRAAVLKTVKTHAVLKESPAGTPAQTTSPAEQAVDARYTPQVTVQEVNVSAADPAKPDAAAGDVVRSTVLIQSPQGVMGYFRGKTLLETTFSQAVQRALERNLVVRFSEKGYEKSGHAIKQARSVFDPVFNFAFNATQFDAFDRREWFDRKRNIAGELENDVRNSIFSAFQASNPDQTVEGFVKRGAFDFASNRGENRTETLTESFTQQIPWGSFFNFSFTQKRNRTVFAESTTENSFTILDTDVNGDPIFLADGQTQRRRSVFYEQHFRSSSIPQSTWTSFFSVKLVVPLPYTKDWGPYGPNEVNIKLAEIGRSQAYWVLQGTINDTLANLSGANPKALGVAGYWDVVRAVRRLELTNATIKSMETVLKHTDELLQANRSTAYEKTLVQQQLSSLKRVEQVQWQSYAVASNALRKLLDQDREVIVLPVGYANLLSGVPPQTNEDAIAIAMANNPDLQAAKASVCASQITLKFAHNQARPDLKLTTGISFFESDAVFGYNSLLPAIGNVWKPDNRTGFIVLNYRVPWGNRPAEEFIHEDEQLYRQQQKRLSATANQVTQFVNDALTSLVSAREQLAIAEKNKQIIDRIYTQLLELWNAGKVADLGPGKNSPAFQIISKNNDVLSAGFRLVDAQIALRKAEAQLLAAEGVLATRYSDELKISLKPIVDAPKQETGKTEAVKEPAK